MYILKIGDMRLFFHGNYGKIAERLDKAGALRGPVTKALNEGGAPNMHKAVSRALKTQIVDSDKPKKPFNFTTSPIM